MRVEDAEVIVGMIDGHWNLRMNNETKDLWLAILLPEDAEDSTAVVAHMAQRMHYAPKIVDFKEVMRMLHPPQPSQTFTELPEGKYGVEAPEWVWVWSWARMMRDPREERSFPQQEGHVDPANLMRLDEYEQLLTEWKEQGSPRSRNVLPTALR